MLHFLITFLLRIWRMLQDWAGLPLHEHEFGENSIMHFSLSKTMEVALVLELTHRHLRFHHSQSLDTNPFEGLKE